MKPGNLQEIVWCQIRRQTRDEDSIYAHIESRCAVFYVEFRKETNDGKKIIYF